eukprot:COSAG03_NODE_18850_length_347_cov_0.625000_1_plen_77_part_01
MHYLRVGTPGVDATRVDDLAGVPAPDNIDITKRDRERRRDTQRDIERDSAREAVHIGWSRCMWYSWSSPRRTAAPQC